MNESYIQFKNKIIQAGSWQEKYREIMLLGKKSPALPSELKVDSALVNGCESNVWLYMDFNNEENKLLIIADSDTRIVKGLVSIILYLYSDLTPIEIISIDANKEFEDMSLLKHLSPSRGNGIKAILNAIQSQARLMSK
ncbi:SufE family protein [Pseudoalteromonas sp. C2R02]|uniref:SufE family protein n=1 Tax=Pseudoalteromonas sp. C2R02 TaxID=2841565 RepID=UPI001C0A1521|nr:SufE family protein [Pseudoalteromonas sp. C2R02]MBU2968514.1 SufE family protein [Pseudoalteromonas sp. C2R02]